MFVDDVCSKLGYLVNSVGREEYTFKATLRSVPEAQEGQEGHVGVPDVGVVGGRGQGPSP